MCHTLKKRLAGLLLGCLSLVTLHGQSHHAKGLVFNAARYRKAVQARDLDVRGPRLRALPMLLSLRPFCPTPQDQGEEPSCTAWAIAYGALTIQQAIHRKVSPAVNVDKIACSKSFVYNQLCEGNPENIPSIESTFDFLRARGTCLAATFRNELPLRAQPDTLAFEEAQGRRLAMVTEVYDPDTAISLARQIQRFKRLLADSIPLVVGLRLPYEFANLQEKVFRYHPAAPLDSAAHALCLIGYDDIDSTFECMNSWGVHWGGDQGFFRIPYRDFFALLCCAYRLTPRFMVEKKSAALKGTAVLRHSVGYSAARTPQFEEIRLRFDSLNGYYQARELRWTPGMGFQLVLRDTPPDWWVYAFQLGQGEPLQLLYEGRPARGAVETVLPGEEARFEIEAAGTQWLGLLYSPTPIPDAAQALRSQLSERPDGMGIAAQPATSAVYNSRRMAFSLPGNVSPQRVLMFLKITAQEE